MKFNKSEIACVTDIHIGIHQNSKLWHVITTKFAIWFKDQLNERGIKDIVICGDVNDDRNEIDINSLNTLTKVFNIWKDFNIFIIVGNHDAYYRDRSDVNSLAILNGWPNITVIDKYTELDQFGKRISFAPWGTEYNQITDCDLMFGHFEINGFSLSKMKACTTGIESANLLNKCPFIVSGHFHIRDDRKYEKGRILYVGSPYEQNWGDCGTDPRGFYLINLEEGTHEFIENTISPKHKKIRLSEITSAGRVTEDIRKEFPGNFVNLVIDQDLPTDKLEIFVEALNNFGPVALKIDYLLEERFGVDDSMKQEFDGIDVKQCMSDFIDSVDNLSDKEDVKRYISELYDECVNS